MKRLLKWVAIEVVVVLVLGFIGLKIWPDKPETTAAATPPSDTPVAAPPVDELKKLQAGQGERKTLLQSLIKDGTIVNLTTPTTQTVKRLRYDAPEAVQSFWKACEAERPKQIADTQRELESNQDSLRNALKDDDVATLKDEIKAGQERLKSLRSGGPVTPPVLFFSYPIVARQPNAITIRAGVGSIGVTKWATVRKVIDKTNMLIYAFESEDKFTFNDEAGVRLLWLTGVDTSNLVEGAKISKVFTLEVIGNKEYDLYHRGAGNAIPVFQVRPFDIADWLTDEPALDGFGRIIRDR